MALDKLQDFKDVNQRRLQRALECFERSLRLHRENIRAWTGQALTYHQMKRYDDEVRCSLRALDADRSDPSLWVLYMFALRAAGKREEALSASFSTQMEK